MGYSIYLIDRNNSLTEEVVDNIIDRLPKRLQDFWAKPYWGWALKADISLCKNKNKMEYLCVSGCCGDENIGIDMTLALQQLLQEDGYKIEVFAPELGYTSKELYSWMGYDINELKSA